MTPQDDAYQSLVQIMREEGGAGLPASPYFIGEVVTASPLVIKIGDLQIEQKNMKINAYLLPGYSRQMGLATTGASGRTGEESGGGGEESFSSHSHAQGTIGVPSGTFTTQDTLRVGMKVLMLASSDGQQYVVICPLV